MSGNFMKPSDWKEIFRGFVYEAVIPYHTSTKRPLTFFKPTIGKTLEGEVINEDGDFNQVVENGQKSKHVEKQIIMKVKPRKCVIVSGDAFNKSTDYQFVQIAPIQGIKPKDKLKYSYPDILADKHPTFAMLPKHITGGECYIDVSDLQNIHKSMLLEKKYEVPIERMQLVEDLIAGWLDLGRLPQPKVSTKTASN